MNVPPPPTINHITPTSWFAPTMQLLHPLRESTKHANQQDLRSNLSQSQTNMHEHKYKRKKARNK